jgi:integrase/recombinase XerD
MVNIRMVKERERRLPNVLNKKQLLQIFGCMEETDVFIGSLLGLCCGLRVSEVCNVKKQDVDFENERIKVVQGKGSKDRYVMLPAKLKPILEKWFRVNDSEMVVPAVYRKTMTGGHLSMRFNKYLRKANLKIFMNKTVTGQSRYAYSFHTLRHTYATFLLEKGVDLYYVQRALGHSDIHTTQIYAYISNKDLQEKINLAFGKKADKSRYESIMDPVQLLQLKYANNELSIEEYKEKLEVLQRTKELFV